MTTLGGPAWSGRTADRPERGDAGHCAGLPDAFEEVNVGEYHGEERRDQSEMGKDIRQLIDEIEVDHIMPREDYALLASHLAQAWRLGFERGRSAGAKEVMKHVELELGALREGLKED